jgi:hypothetical protein
VARTALSEENKDADDPINKQPEGINNVHFISSTRWCLDSVFPYISLKYNRQGKVMNTLPSHLRKHSMDRGSGASINRPSLITIARTAHDEPLNHQLRVQYYLILPVLAIVWLS